MVAVGVVVVLCLWQGWWCFVLYVGVAGGGVLMSLLLVVEVAALVMLVVGLLVLFGVDIVIVDGGMLK